MKYYKISLKHPYSFKINTSYLGVYKNQGNDLLGWNDCHSMHLMRFSKKDIICTLYDNNKEFFVLPARYTWLLELQVPREFINSVGVDIGGNE